MPNSDIINTPGDIHNDGDKKNNKVQTAIGHLLDRFVHKTRRQTGNNPRFAGGDSLPDREQSPAFISITDQAEIEWLPAPNGKTDELFSHLEAGLELELHKDLKQYYGAFWSEGICCQSNDGLVQLIQLWNDTDLELLRENLLGHAFMKSKKRQPITFFFGLGEGENMLTIDNATGVVYKEIAGRRPYKQLAENLADYLNSLEVTLLPYGSV